MDTPATPVELRPAVPDESEGLRFAHYLEAAADGLFRFMLGRRFDSIIAKTFPETGHDMSYEYVTFAERDGDIVGMVSGYTADQHKSASSNVLLRAAPLRIFRLLAVMSIASRALRFTDQVAHGDYYLQAVAVDPEARGGGIGSILLDHAESVATAAGSQRLVLDVAEDNPAAKRLYERRGMSFEAQSPRIAFVPNSSFIRMVKPLS